MGKKIASQIWGLIFEGEQGWYRENTHLQSMRSLVRLYIPRLRVICALRLLLVLCCLREVFSPATPVFPLPQKTRFPESEGHIFVLVQTILQLMVGNLTHAQHYLSGI